MAKSIFTGWVQCLGCRVYHRKSPTLFFCDQCGYVIKQRLRTQVQKTPKPIQPSTARTGRHYHTGDSISIWYCPKCDTLRNWTIIRKADFPEESANPIYCRECGTELWDHISETSTRWPKRKASES